MQGHKKRELYFWSAAMYMKGYIKFNLDLIMFINGKLIVTYTWAYNMSQSTSSSQSSHKCSFMQFLLFKKRLDSLLYIINCSKAISIHHVTTER